MSKPKYPFEKRLEVVNHYFTTDDGYRIISARFGVPEPESGHGLPSMKNMEKKV
ncbi:transposase [Escherichia coli]|nr:transposase [Escherichia coli]